jgi:hypothetical protein
MKIRDRQLILPLSNDARANFNDLTIDASVGVVRFEAKKEQLSRWA